MAAAYGFATLMVRLRRLAHRLTHAVFWVLVRVHYPLRVHGRVPVSGGALLVCNHLSFVDPFLVSAATTRPVRFLVYEGLHRQWPVRLLSWLVRAIPIAAEQRPRQVIRALHVARQAVRDGELVCIFAEGEMSRTGQLLPFRRGLERIMAGLGAPIVPVHLGGVWGSIFSFERGRYFWKWPRGLRRSVSYGLSMAPSSTAQQVRRAVQDVQTDA